MFVKKFENQDWQAYKAIRLEALSLHADVYGNSLALESAFSDDIWQGRITAPRQAFFGLYDGDRLIGTGGVVSDINAKDGKSAVFVGDYVQERYRGQNLSRLLYEARIKWVIDCGYFNQITTGHKKGNEAARRASQAFGFDYTGQEEKVWGDGSRGLLMRYEIRLAS